MISGASAPIGCTVSPPVGDDYLNGGGHTIEHQVQQKARGRGRWASENPGAARLAGCVVKGGRAIAALPDVSAEDALVKLRRAHDIGGGHLDVADFAVCPIGSHRELLQEGSQPGIGMWILEQGPATLAHLLLTRGWHLQLVDLVVVWYVKPTRWNFPGSCGVKCFARGPDS